MRKRLIKYLVLAFFILIQIHPIVGQEGDFMIEGLQEENGIDETPVQEISPKENRPSQETKTHRSTTMSPRKGTGEQQRQSSDADAVVEENSNEESDESVLSFNFLHYIIQKFKFSDVLHQ